MGGAPMDFLDGTTLRVKIARPSMVAAETMRG